MSSRPKASSAVWTIACWSSHSVTSHRTTTACSGPPSSSARPRSLSSERAASTTRCPASTARRAVAAPIPLEAPVMRKTGVSWLPFMGDMLADKARIEVRGGAGGNGSVSFRREAHVPKGGPDGGDGGRGGDGVLRCDDNLRDLQFFKRPQHFRAARGGHGQGALKHGADGDPLVVPVPPGTQVERWDGARFDLVVPGQEVTIARGGAGGRGHHRVAPPPPPA